MARFKWTNRFTARLAATALPLTTAAQDRNFIEGHLDPVYMLDLEGRLIDFNEKLALLLGHTTSSMYNHFSTFTVKEDLPAVMEQYQRALTGQETTYFCRAIHRDGHILTLQITNIPVYDQQLIVGVYGIARDVTAEMQLKEERERLVSEQRLMSEAPGLTYFCVNASGEITSHSKALLEAKHLKKWDGLVREIHPEDRDHVRRLYEGLVEGTILEQEVEFRTRGPMIQHYVGKMGRFNDTVRGVFTNVTAHHLLSTTVSKHAARLDDLYEHVDASIYKKTLRTGEIEFYTHGFEKLFKVTQEAMALDPNAHRNVIHRNDRLKVRAAHTKAEAGEPAHVLFRIVTETGIQWVDKKLVPHFEGESVTAVMSVARDVTKIKEQEEKIWQLAMHDSLTGLPNRSLFLHELEERMARFDHVAVFSVSFNSIHRINQDFGYTVGDDWIVAVTSALLHHLPKDSYIGHLAGDEFMFCLPNVPDEATLAGHCKALLRLEDTPIQIGPYEWAPKVSIGVSRSPGDASTAAELLQQANTALGRTHVPGANRFVFYASSFNVDLFRRYQLGNDLRRAIEEDELFLEFQPKVDAWSGRVVGAEALVRWLHPEWGRIPPSDFIPLSEESELHLKLADWVLDRTCAYLATWTARDLPVVPVSINVSPKRLLHGNYAETIKRVLKRHGVAASLLEIEILETDVLSDNPKIRDILAQLEAANIRVALDDFGTGYSSLSYLQKYPIKTIKIDQQFASDLHENQKTQGIVRTILFMADEFKMDVVIEGVETLEQLEMVRSLNCRIVQGYLFTRPLGEDDFLKALHTRFLSTSETATTPHRRFSLDAMVTIHRFHERIVSVGSTPVVITKSNLRSVHFYAKVRLPVVDGIELRITCLDIELLVRLVEKTDLGNAMYEYEAAYLDLSESHRIVTALQRHMT